MNLDDLPLTALDMARQPGTPRDELTSLEGARHQAVAEMLPTILEREPNVPPDAAQIAQATDSETSASPLPWASAVTPTTGQRSLAFPETSSRSLAPLDSPGPMATERSSTLQQQLEAKVRVERELKIQVEDNIEELAQRTGDYLVSQLDQREQQLLERIAQQINQQPTRRAHLSGPGTMVGG